MSLRDALRAFADEMEKELKKNEFRGEWRERSPSDIMASLWEELYDLDDAVERMYRGEGDRKEVLKEAVDVANYAMFVADICLISMGPEK